MMQSSSRLFNRTTRLSSAPVVAAVFVSLIFLSACEQNLIRLPGSMSSSNSNNTAALPPVSGPKYPEAETSTGAGAGTTPDAVVSNSEADWRKMLEPYLTQETPKLNQPVMPPAISAPVLTPIGAGTVRAGILLPLSGPNAPLGMAMLNAAQMALFDFADADFELLPHDTAGQPEQASFAATMVIGDGASLMVGPLLSRSAHAVGPISRAAGVPVIAFSSDSTVAGDGIYSLGFLPRNEVDRVAAFAMSQGLRRFAVLAPGDPYGEAVVEAFQAALTRYGGTLVQVATYHRSGADIDGVVKELADYEVRRAALLRERKLLEGMEDELSLNAMKRLEVMDTLGDLPYEALLLADGGDRLQQAAALLPFYDIDPRKVQILGTGQLDTPGIGAEPALVGAWFAAPPPDARAKFQRRYEQTYGKKPPRLATLAYDATALAAVLARSGNPYPYGPESMQQSSGFAGRDGLFRFAPDGTADRGLAVLQVEPRQNVVINPSPVNFTALVN
jgi:branched-chain amino acid transport system substrate-binding protein